MTERSGPSVVVAGGGSAGHIEPALALADAVRRLHPEARITALGTERGLDTTLIPARGYPLELIPPVPLPRRPSADLLRLPGRIRAAVARVRAVLAATAADVVVGFGGYVALPAYLGARGRVPIVVHEANARAGLANKVGARFAARVVAAVPGSGLRTAEVLGIPLRRAVTQLDRAALRPAARARFGLPATGPVLLVFGGSQGARTLNTRRRGRPAGLVHARHRRPARPRARTARCRTPARRCPRYVPLPYIDDMHLAYAAADAVLCRAGAMTVAEVSAVGLPAVYVPLPHGNGEQALNATPGRRRRRRRLVADAELTGERVLADRRPAARRPGPARGDGRRGPRPGARRRRRAARAGRARRRSGADVR